jgi:hypothetical protein
VDKEKAYQSKDRRNYPRNRAYIYLGVCRACGRVAIYLKRYILRNTAFLFCQQDFGDQQGLPNPC